MIFNEIYGCYYNVVAKLISRAITGELTEKEMYKIVSESAYEESSLSLIPAIKQQDWQLIDKEYNTPIKNKPAMPLTILEKRWLKTILLDPRIALFDIPSGGLNDVEPLFFHDDIVYFDRYLDGDDYKNPVYIANFHIIMQAIKEHRKVSIIFVSARNEERRGIFYPIKMEYSDKEDKFRVLTAGRWDIRTVNMGRILKCELLEETFDLNMKLPGRNIETVVFEVQDVRNVLERVMMQFAHYRKQVEKIEEGRYLVEVKYDKDDETDVLIQIMTFGSFVRIISPENMKTELAKRISKQISIMKW